MVDYIVSRHSLGSYYILRSLNEITGYSLQASDGNIGCCEDRLFDDKIWFFRYMLADTSAGLPSSKNTLPSPISLSEPNGKNTQLPVTLTRELLENNPQRDEHKPVSREYETNFFDYYGYGYYWIGAGPWGSSAAPIALAKVTPDANVTDDGERIKEVSTKERDLRYAKKVEGYTIESIYGEMGQVEDFVLNDVDWTIAYIIVNARNWLLSGRKVLIVPSWLSSVSWVKRMVSINLTSEKIEGSPEYDPSQLIDPEYEVTFHDFYEKLKKISIATIVNMISEREYMNFYKVKYVFL